MEQTGRSQHWLTGIWIVMYLILELLLAVIVLELSGLIPEIIMQRSIQNILAVQTGRMICALHGILIPPFLLMWQKALKLH